MVGESRPDDQSAWLQAAVLPGMIVILLAAVILFLPSYLDSYLGDDFVQQWRIRKLIDEPLKALTIFGPGWTNWYYRPLQNIWMLISRQIFGLTPTAYYILQICWHLIGISLLFRVARGFGMGRLGALVAASLFAINAAHHLAVDWISSIGIIAATSLSLGAVAAFNHYLNRDQRNRYLGFSVLLWLGALFFHETSFLLPILTFFIWLSHPKRRKPDKWLTSFAVLTVGLMTAYLWTQITRENANLSSDAILAFNSSVLNHLTELGQFLLRITAGWIGIETVDEWIVDNLRGSSLIFGTAAVTLLIAAIILFIKGTRSVRLGLTWAAMQIGFIYIVLWSTRPELLGGRHLYSAWAGMSIAFGAAVEMVILHFSASPAKKRSGLSRAQKYSLLLVSAFIFFQFFIVLDSQRSTRALAVLVKDLESQMKHILPEVTNNTRVFASRFTLTPSYFAPTAAVWYAEPGLTGGDIDTLKDYPFVTSDFYLFDTDEKKLINLLPTFQEHAKSYLLWSEEPASVTQEANGEGKEIPPEAVEAEVIAGTQGDQRLATCINADSGRWLTIAYKSEAPVDGRLAVSYFSESDADIRIRHIDSSGVSAPILTLEYQSPSGSPWMDIEIPIDLNAGAVVTILFEARMAQDASSDRVCWSNPRFVVD